MNEGESEFIEEQFQNFESIVSPGGACIWNQNTNWKSLNYLIKYAIWVHCIAMRDTWLNELEARDWTNKNL